MGTRGAALPQDAEVAGAADYERAEALAARLADADPDNDAAAVEGLDRWLTRFAPTPGTAPLEGDLERYQASWWLWIASELGNRPGHADALDLFERAHALAVRTASPTDLDRAAFDLGNALLRAGELQRADAVAGAVLDGEPSAVWHPQLLLLRTRIARLQGRAEDGSRRLDELLADGLLRDRDPATDADLRHRHRTVRGLALGERARIELLLGRLDHAAAAAYEALDLAAAGSDVGGARPRDLLIELDARLAIAALEHLRLDFRGALDEVDALVAEQLIADDDANVLFLRGRAEAELEKADPQRPRVAAALLERALADPTLDGLWALDATWMLSDLALDREDFAGAERWLEAARERRRTLVADGEGPALFELPLIANEAELACATGASGETLRRCLAELDAASGAMLAAWERASVGRGSVGFLENGHFRSVLGEIARVSNRLDGAAGNERALDAWLAAQGRGSLARERGLAPVRWSDVRSTLSNDGGGLLAYLVTSPTTHLLAIDAEGVEYFPLRGAYRLQATVEGLARDLRIRAPLNADAAARRLRVENLTAASEAAGAELLPPAVWDRVSGWTSVTIVGGDFLWGLPPEAIGTPDGRLLGEAAAIAQAASIPIAVDDARRHASDRAVERSGPDFALLATLEPSDAVGERFGGLQRVALEPRDLAPLLAPWPAAGRRLVLDPAPTPRDFIDAFESAAVTQVLAHGVLDTFRERGSGVALAGAGESGLLWPETVDALPLAARGAVVLTSCGTAVGPRRQGDDQFAHLAGALLARGASGVVTTRSRLELDLADDLAIALGRGLVEGYSLAEALRRARARLGRDDRERAFELARVQLLGSPRSPFGDRPPAARWSVAPAIALGAVLLSIVGAAVGALAARRRRENHS